MSLQRWSLALTAVLCTLSACVPGPSGPAVGKGSGLRAADKTSPSAAPATQAASPSPTGTVPGSTPQVVLSLTGSVKLPASLVTNGGGNVVSNGGGNLVSNGGGNYRVSALSQVPVGDVAVRLIDAKGQPIFVDGKALEGRTDAQGRFAIEAPLPDQNLFLEATLPGDKGTVQAFVPRGGGTKTVDADLVSTLTTGYIRDQYVKTQPDPVKTLDKLPGEVENETRAKAGAALEGGTTAVPPALTTEAVVSTVTKLRDDNAALDAQFETVKKLLIAAGQLDLGNGQPATEVSLRDVSAFVHLPDGTLAMLSDDDNRVWRLDKAGRMHILAGNGTAPADSDEGKPATEVGLATRWMGLDQQGRILLAEYDRLLRLETTGTLTVLWRASDDDEELAFAVPDGADGLLLAVVSGEFGEWEAKVWAQDAQQARKLVHTFDAEEAEYLREAMSYGFGRRTDGTITFLALDSGASGYQAHHLNSQTWARTEGPEGLLVVDHLGHLFRWSLGSVIALTDSGMLARSVSVPRFFESAHVAGAYVDAAGTLFFSYNDQVYQVNKDAAAPQLIAGIDGQASGNANEVAIARPSGVATLANGDFLVADEEAHRVLRITPSGTASTFAGNGKDSQYNGRGDNGPAVEAVVPEPTVVRTDKAGNVYVLEDAGVEYGIRKIDASGTITSMVRTRLPATPGTGVVRFLEDFVPEDDGRLLVVVLERNNEAGDQDPKKFSSRLERYDGQGRRVATLQAFDYNTGLFSDGPSGTRLDRLCPGLDGKLYVTGEEEGVATLWTLDAAGNLTVVDTQDRFTADGTRIAVDSQGRVYLNDRENNKIHRYHPGTKTFEAIAGAGTSRFSGTGVENSLNEPVSVHLDAQGNLYISDAGNKQVKRIPAAQLP